MRYLTFQRIKIYLTFPSSYWAYFNIQWTRKSWGHHNVSFIFNHLYWWVFCSLNLQLGLGTTRHMNAKFIIWKLWVWSEKHLAGRITSDYRHCFWTWKYCRDSWVALYWWNFKRKCFPQEPWTNRNLSTRHKKPSFWMVGPGGPGDSWNNTDYWCSSWCWRHCILRTQDSGASGQLLPESLIPIV